MRNLLLTTALCVAAPVCLATAANAQQTLAQQTVTFLCAAPAGHVCQFAVQTGGSQIDFRVAVGRAKGGGRRSRRTLINIASAIPAP